MNNEAKWIIERIFDLTVHGASAAEITKILAAEKVSTPGWLNFKRHGAFSEYTNRRGQSCSVTSTARIIVNLVKMAGAASSIMSVMIFFAPSIDENQVLGVQMEPGEEQLLERLLKTGDKERAAKAERCKAKVDRLFAKMYEDWSAERITGYNYNNSPRSIKPSKAR